MFLSFFLSLSASLRGRQVHEPADGKWGYQLENGSWTGVIGTVERYEADASMDILITADRDEYVDFTIGYHTEPLTFVTTKPRVRLG